MAKARWCLATTSTGRPCSIPADRLRADGWYCHVHDPEGVCRANAGRAMKRPRPERVDRIDYDPPHEDDGPLCDPPFEATGIYDRGAWLAWQHWKLDREYLDATN